MWRYVSGESVRDVSEGSDYCVLVGETALLFADESGVGVPVTFDDPLRDTMDSSGECRDLFEYVYCFSLIIYVRRAIIAVSS